MARVARHHGPGARRRGHPAQRRHRIPLSAKRLDLLIAGHAADDRRSAVIVELKQWDHAQLTPKDAIVRTYVGGGVREAVHPSYQAWSYAELMKSFNAAVDEGDIGIWPCAYLHNYISDGAIDSDHYDRYTSMAPLFLKGEDERTRLRQFIPSTSIAATDCASSTRSKRVRSAHRRNWPTASLAC